MALTALLYLLLIFLGIALSLWRGPMWGILTYIFVYLLTPDPRLNWWASDLPTIRWSILLITVILISCALHKDRLSNITLIKGLSTGKLLTAYLVLSIVVSLKAVDPSLSISRCYDFFRYIVVYYLLVKTLKTRGSVQMLIVTIILCGLILGYMAYTTPRVSGRLENVGPPDASDANNLGLLFATMIPLTLPLFMKKNWIWRMLAIGSFVFMANGLILCNSRGATLSLIAAVLVVVFLMRLPGTRKKILLCIALMACGFIYLTDHTFIERFRTIKESANTDRGTGRLDVWKYGLKMAQDYPFGSGGSGFQLLSKQYVPEKLLTMEGVRSSHNTFILILTEQGVLGFIIAAFFILSVMLSLKASYQMLWSKFTTSQQTSKDITFDYSAIVSLTASLTCSLVGSIFADRLYYEFLYIVAALAVAMHHQIKTMHLCYRESAEQA